MANLPDDIILGILVRVPVKSIGRFRCLNKAWNNLLNDGEFVQKHLNHATQINRLSLLLHSSSLGSNENDIYTIDYDPASYTCTGYVNTSLSWLMYKFGDFGTFKFIGYCNGLVCVRPYLMDIVCLWNPSTNEYKDLPYAPFSCEHRREDIQFGFGFNGDFKVVSLVSYSGQPGSEVHVYTLKSDSWITLESIPYTVYSQPDIAQIPVNGVIHWKAYIYEGSERVRKFILSFDFDKELFQEMSWPNFLDKTFNTNLCVLGGSLCLCGFNRRIGLEVWELKDHRAEESWSKLFTIDVKKHFGFVEGMTPLQSLKNGEFLLGIDRVAGFHVHQYDPKHETTSSLIVYEGSEKYCSSTTVCVESLVSLNSCTFVYDEVYGNEEEGGDEHIDDDDVGDEND